MDIATQKLFVEVLKDKRNIVAPYSTTAKVKNITNDTIYVVLSGSNITTPIKTTNVSVKVGDTVDVIVSHEDTRITGNRTDVAASSKSTEKMAQAFERSSIEMANKLNIVGNEITAINNTIELLDNEIKIKDSEIEVINSSIINIDSTINTINSNIATMESDISTQGSKIDIMGSQLSSQNSTINTINSNISAQDAKINTMKSDISTQGSKISTIESDISTQGSKISTMESDISTQGSKIDIMGSQLSSQNSTINTIKSNIFTQDAKIDTINSDITILNSAFTIENGKLTGISEIITNILESDYVTTDFLNASVAWIENGKIKESAIGETEIADASITTAKIKELSADVIKAGTLSAERLILTTDEENPETGEKKVALITAMNAAAETEEGGLLDGAIISDKTINAAKIDVVDLKAFGATIGNFKIDTSSMYNAKKSLTDPTNGVYIGTDGIALGQGSLLNMTDDSPFRVESDGDFHLGGKASNFINFDPFTGELEINAKTIKIESSDIADRISTLEQNSEGFTWTIDETAIVSSVNEYYPSTSPTELLGGDWSTNSPTWTEGTYIWMRTKNTNGKGDPSYTKAVCVTGNTGAAGASSSIWYSDNPPTGYTGTHNTFLISNLSGDSSRTPNVGDIIFFNAGPNGNFYAPIEIILNNPDRAGIRSSTTKQIDGADGKGVSSIKEQYYHSTSRTELAGDSWSDTAPTPTVGKYIWTRTVISYTYGNPTTTSAICVTGNDGTEGSDGVGVTSVDVEYYKSTSPTSVTGGSWQTTAPTISSGTYLWSRSKVTYTSGDPKYTKAYCVSKAMAESIDVGGRNLLLNSKGPFVVEVKAADNYNYYRFYADMITGEIYTISADIEVLVGSFDEVTVYPYPGGTHSSVSISTNGRITKTFTKTAESINSVLIYAGLSGSTKGNSIRISNVKIEKGNKATDWTPAPEDIYQAIEDVEVGGVNLLSDTNVPSTTKKAGPGNKYLSESGYSSYMSGSFVAVSDLPIPDFTHAYQFECKTASSTATAGRSLCFYSGAIVPMINGETYTMSMYARKVSGNGKIRFVMGYDKYPNSNNYVDVTSKWEKYSYTFTYYDSDVYNDSTKTGGARCYFGANCAVIGTVQICGCKLEKGNKATDWCPSAADSLYANNYMHFADNGLTIGNMTASTLGKNVLINLDSVNIRNGSEVLARYGENIVLRHAGKDAFTIKSSTFLTEVNDEGRMIDEVSNEYERVENGITTFIMWNSNTSTGRHLLANRVYVWHINKVNRYAIFKVPNDCYVRQIWYSIYEPAYLHIYTGTNGSEEDIYVNCSYADGDAALNTTIKGNLWINSNADVSGSIYSIPPLGIGTVGGEHLEIDNNEIIAKTDGETPGILYLNSEGGPVSINNNGNYAFKFDEGRFQFRRLLADNIYSDWRNIIKILDASVDIENVSTANINTANISVIEGVSKIVAQNDSSYGGRNTRGERRDNFQPCDANNNCVIGYDSHLASEGSTNIYGTNIKFFSKNFINADRKLKTLWTGAYIMTAPQSCSLSESISNQLNGVVLEWSLYDNGTVANGNYVHHFIPKSFVASHSGADVRLFLGAGYAAYKILYISDSSITGNIDNDDVSKSYYGLTVNNNKFVLRNIYGV